MVGSGGGHALPDGTLVVPWPVYADDVCAFFVVAGQPWWTDTGYEPREAGRRIRDPERLATAGWAEVRSMLTWCARGERFGDGFWGEILRSGLVTALLRRVRELGDPTT